MPCCSLATTSSLTACLPTLGLSAHGETCNVSFLSLPIECRDGIAFDVHRKWMAGHSRRASLVSSANGSTLCPHADSEAIGPSGFLHTA
jgi:hypothetical protein